ncbi:MAG: hypothetical protein JKY54_06790 [Flavobacteriales bacterium]|nr:hypothetical protein [Flavobacteriales bacterium]
MKTKSILQAPMSNILINKYFDGKSNILSLEQIAKMTSLDQVMRQKDHCVVYMSINGSGYGHWVCIFINSGNMYYFDSYGRKPLIYIEEMRQRGDDMQNQDFTLLKLIQESQYKDSFFYNTVQFQSSREDIATCGRFVSVVLILNRIQQPFNLKIFHDIMIGYKKKMKKSYDEIVSFFINQ